MHNLQPRGIRDVLVALASINIFFSGLSSTPDEQRKLMMLPCPLVNWEETPPHFQLNQCLHDVKALSN